jgi:hypothetical protein
MTKEAFKHGYAPPKISYQRCMRSFFVLNATVYSVEMCSAEVFLEFVATCPKRGTRAYIGKSTIIQMIEEAEEADSNLVRWHALDSMLSGGYAVRLFDSEQDARNSQIVYNHP